MTTKKGSKQQDEKKVHDATEARLAMAPLTARLAVLDTLTVAQLQAEHERLFGEPTRSRNKQHLRKRVAWKIQEQAEGGLTPRALDRIEQLAADAPARWRQPSNGVATPALPAAGDDRATRGRDPRLPAPGTVIRKTHKGVVHEITVLDDAFEYLGVRYKSLSAIAKVVTGTFWNGYLWLQLTARKPKADAEPAAASTPDAAATEEGSR